MGLSNLVCGHRSKWVVLVVWLAVGVATLSFVAKLQDVTTDDETAFLPHDAESTRLIEAEDRLGSAERLDLTVVYRRDIGHLTEPDKERIAFDKARLIDRYHPPESRYRTRSPTICTRRSSASPLHT